MVNVVALRVLSSTVLAAAMGLSFAASAEVLPTITDQILVNPYKGGCSGSGCEAPGYANTDFLGTNYNTTAIDITRDVTTGMTVTLTTKKAAFQYVGGTWTSSNTHQGRYESLAYADLAIAVHAPTDANLTGPSSDFDYGVELNNKSVASGGNGISQTSTGGKWNSSAGGYVNLYEAPAGSADNAMWLTSMQAYGAGAGGGIYGGMACVGAGSTCTSPEFAPITNVAANLASAIASSAPGKQDVYVEYEDLTYETKIEITFSVSILERMGIIVDVNGERIFSPFELLWGTAWCGNDVIWGYVDGDAVPPPPPPPPEVPEPATLALLGFGALGLAMHRRRRRAF